MRAEKPELSVFVDGLAILVDWVLLAQRVAHAHDHAAFDLSLARAWVHGLANVMRRDDLLELPGLFVEDAHLRRVAVRNMGNWIRLIRAEGVCFRVVFAVELLPIEVLHRAALECRAELFARSAARFARDERLT